MYSCADGAFHGSGCGGQSQVRVAYLDCFSGISGDMFLAALVDSGVPVAVLQEAVDRLKLGVRLECRRVDRSGISAVKADVLTDQGVAADAAEAHFDGHQSNDQPQPHSHAHSDGRAASHAHTHEPGHSHSHVHARSGGHGRSLSTIQGIIREAGLPASAAELALRTFELLGNAEAKIHNVPVESIHFHEVGAVDAIADIVAVAAGCHWLQIERWYCSPVNVGGGHVHCAHGTYPVPAPATLELLRELSIYSAGAQKEMATPTGAALLRALEASPAAFPAMAAISTGYGAGTRDLPGQPNVLRLVVGESDTSSENAGHVHPGAAAKVGVIETTIDDATPELLSYIADRLLAAGASEVYRTPVQMKKGRTGTQLTVLCSPARSEELKRLVFAESTTLGLRYREEQKVTLARTVVTVETEWGAVRIKLGLLESGEVVNYAPEYEDCRQIAERNSVPLKAVMQSAVSAYQAQRRPRLADVS